MSVKLERESQEREEAMQQIREQEAKLNEAKAKVRLVLCSALTPGMKTYTEQATSVYVSNIVQCWHTNSVNSTLVTPYSILRRLLTTLINVFPPRLNLKARKGSSSKKSLKVLVDQYQTTPRSPTSPVQLLPASYHQCKVYVPHPLLPRHQEGLLHHHHHLRPLREELLRHLPHLVVFQAVQPLPHLPVASPMVGSSGLASNRTGRHQNLLSHSSPSIGPNYRM